MGELETELRAALATVADAGPNPARLANRFRTSMRHDTNPRRRVLLPFLTAAAVATIAAAAAFVQLGDSHPPDRRQGSASASLSAPDSSVPNESDVEEVNQFAAAIRADWGSKVYLATLWNQGQIRIAVSSPIPDRLQSLDGSKVGGLTVVVSAAPVTNQEFQTFISEVGDASFPGAQDVCSFNLSPDAMTIEVQVRGLSTMTPEEKGLLAAQLTSMTDAEVRLVEARIVVLPEGGSTGDGTC